MDISHFPSLAASAHFSFPALLLGQMDVTGVYVWVGRLTYLALFAIAAWGAYSVVMVWSRIGMQRFKTEEEQDEMLGTIESSLEQGRFDEAMELCDGDQRAICRLAAMAIEHRRIGFEKVRQLLLDRFQRDVLEDLETRISWVNTVIKAAPMIGLFGTVLGMMGAFGKLAAAENVQPDQLAEDISLALITTASGLAIAIPLVLAVTMINVRIRKLEDLASGGLTRFLETFRYALNLGGRQGS
jgi:biopolymer transport protein ExbB